MANTIPMERDGKTADVHPAEVDNYRLGGWTPVERAEPRKKVSPKPVVKAPESGADK